jgi:ribosomal protein S18 acetylase RimI-like enzyme
MEVRAVRPDEFDVAGRVVLAGYRALPGESLSDGYAAQLLDVTARVRGAEVLVAVEAGAAPGGAAVGGAVVGCVTFVPDMSSPWAEGVAPGEAAIRMLAVDPGAQGRGVGGALLDACVARAAALGRRGVFLHSTPAMAAAHRLYRRAGFVRVPDRDWCPAPDVMLWAFRLDLSPGARTSTPARRSGRC